MIPGGGQIYNRKYWKLPIFYGGFAGCAYALTWNSKMYKDYSTAYKDAMNGNMQSSSITDLLPPGYTISETQLKELLRKRKDTYRRYRDLSIFAFIGVYLLSVIDAYVDAELSNFDITPRSQHEGRARRHQYPNKQFFQPLRWIAMQLQILKKQIKQIYP